MEEAIKRAVMVGYDYVEIKENEFAPLLRMSANNIALLDPLFWQALGRHEGWGKESYFEDQWDEESWKKQMHSFIDHIAEGKSVDSFFDGILKGGISS